MIKLRALSAGKSFVFHYMLIKLDFPSLENYFCGNFITLDRRFINPITVFVFKLYVFFFSNIIKFNALINLFISYLYLPISFNMEVIHWTTAVDVV